VVENEVQRVIANECYFIFHVRFGVETDWGWEDAHSLSVVDLN